MTRKTFFLNLLYVNASLWYKLGS